MKCNEFLILLNQFYCIVLIISLIISNKLNNVYQSIVGAYSSAIQRISLQCALLNSEGRYFFVLIHKISNRVLIPTKNRIAVHQHEFAKRNVKVLAHSVDQLKSHVDWVNDIKSYCLDIPGEFPYPIIADPKRELAVKFGMLDERQVNEPDAATTVRALFIISPDHRVRITMHYPASCGRNVDEILRCIDSLQLTDRLKIVATPANCKFNKKNSLHRDNVECSSSFFWQKNFMKIDLIHVS